MKKVIGFVLIVLVFTLLYFRAENPRAHFSKYSSEQNGSEMKRSPAQDNSEISKKKTLK